ncbi:MAG: N4-gp56 family major capsid protein [Candidatus Fimenecus sp.]
MATVTKLEKLVNPQVMADMISAKIKEKIVVTPFAKIDTTLQGRAGDTITVPSYKYIGDAEDVAEGVAVGTVGLETSTETFKVKKAMKAVSLTDEAVLSGYGNPVGETNTQLAKSIAAKVDNDAITALSAAQLKYTKDASKAVSYSGIVNACDLFDEEVQSEKVMFVNPKQVTQIRLDKDFVDKTKYTGDVMLTGEIGMIAGVRIVPSKKIKATAGKYMNPIIKLNGDNETEDEAAALTVFIKRDTNVETERHTLSRTTDISVDKLYGVAITNQAKVVLAEFAETVSA